MFFGVGTNATNNFEQIDPKIQAGLGLEYLVKENIGVYLYGEHNLAFSDQLDNIDAGSMDDMFYRFGVGINYYLTQPSTQFNKKKELERLKKKEIKALKRENRRKMQEELKSNRKSKSNN